MPDGVHRIYRKGGQLRLKSAIDHLCDYEISWVYFYILHLIVYHLNSMVIKEQLQRSGLNIALSPSNTQVFGEVYDTFLPTV